MSFHFHMIDGSPPEAACDLECVALISASASAWDKKKKQLLQEYLQWSSLDLLLFVLSQMIKKNKIFVVALHIIVFD